MTTVGICYERFGSKKFREGRHKMRQIWAFITIVGVLLCGWQATGSASGLIVSSYSDVENAEASFDNFSVTRLEPTLSSLESTAQKKAVPGYEASRAQKDDHHKVDRRDNRR